jgi:hypothetical protein
MPFGIRVELESELESEPESEPESELESGLESELSRSPVGAEDVFNCHNFL